MKSGNNDKEFSHKDPAVNPARPFVIVIGRQFGSGGRKIGKLISQKLGIEYYDTELLHKVAEAEGIHTGVLKDHDEKKPSLLKLLLQGAYGIPDNFHQVPISSEQTYKAQGKVIKEICSKQSCVIVGRNADIILKNHPRLFSVFLHSPQNTRVKSILSRKEAESEEKALELLQRKDKRRESFYNYYTGDKKWGIASNYHLSIDTSFLDNETVADLIISMARNKFSRQDIRQK